MEESANQLLYLLSDALSEADRELMAIATIRSDALGLWQQHPAVRGNEGRPELTFETFPLGQMRCLSPRKSDRDLGAAAKELLIGAMRSEASRRRIGTDRIGATALVESVERRKQAR